VTGQQRHSGGEAKGSGPDVGVKGRDREVAKAEPDMGDENFAGFPGKGGMQRPLLTLSGVSKSFRARGREQTSNVDGVLAVRNVMLSIYPGEFLGIVGESGSGKSTLGRIIVGLATPSAGSVQWMGRAGTGARQMVFQDPRSSLDPRMRIGSAILEGLPGRRRPRSERLDHVERALREVGLPPELRDAFPHELSGGQAQRVCIARTIIGEPELVVLDEVVSALDISTSVEILKTLAELNASTGITFVFISHDLKAVSQVCTRIAVMSQGRIVEEVENTRQRSVTWIHPYSRILYAADVSHLRRGETLPVSERVPPTSRNVSGCDVADRCVVAKEECFTTSPELKRSGKEGVVLCHFPEALAATAGVRSGSGGAGGPGL